MKTILFGLPCLLALSSADTWAHRPYIDLDYGTKDAPISIFDPEISRAYYRELNGSPEHYQIKSEQPFLLHVNILEAYRPDARKNFKVELFQSGQAMATLEGGDWVYFDEPWGGDEYWMGQKFEREVEAGEYRVVVSNPGNLGKYVLAVGTIDTFPPGEIVRTILVLPKIKSRFFEKSAWSAYFNYSGLFVLLLLLSTSLLIAGGLKVARRHILRQRK